MKSRWPGFLLIAVILVFWEVASAANFIDPVAFPRISLIGNALYENVINGELPSQMLVSVARIFSGFAIAVAVAVPLGSAHGDGAIRLPPHGADHRAFAAGPKLGLYPCCDLFLGIGNEMKVFVVFLACLFPYSQYVWRCMWRGSDFGGYRSHL